MDHIPDEKIILLRRMSDRFAWTVKEGMRSSGRFPGEMFLLRAIYESPQKRITPSAISRLLPMSPPTISPIIARLEEQNLLRRVPSKTDRRQTYLEATAEGAEVYAQIRGSLTRYYQDLARRLTEEELDSFLTLLDKITPMPKEDISC